MRLPACACARPRLCLLARASAHACARALTCSCVCVCVPMRARACVWVRVFPRACVPQDVADAVAQMHVKGRYRELLLVVETCQAATLYSRIQ
jgi:hypothetical protein